jgi:alkyl hydroperoxide reductase subunit F
LANFKDIEVCMLDIGMIEQLKNVFTKLENEIHLVYKKSSHEDQNKLLDLFKDLNATSNKIITRESELENNLSPEFSIEFKGKFNGISFKGIPTGHEFTSLVLAILNSDGKGKFPDPQMISRIKNLKGPVELSTFVSLTCENCPDVVQNLNLMSIIHGDFKHQMIDGAYYQNEIEKLKIQGVPSVMSGTKLISSGKIELIDLIAKLESEFGIAENANTNIENLDLGEFDVVVIGAGPAGVSSAIYSARKGLKTAIVAERIGGQVKDTKGIENLISVPYTEGPMLADQLNTHMREYPIKILEHRRVLKVVNDNLKYIEFESGEFLKTKTMIVATGAKWRELNIPGEKEYIGRGVAFCPHCDGPYYKGKDVAVVGGGNSGIEAAIDLAQIVKSVTVFEFMDKLKADEVLVQKCKALPNIKMITNAKTETVIGDGSKVTSLVYLDRETNELKDYKLDGIFVQIGLLPNSQFVKDIVQTNKMGEIIVDEKNRTNVKGIFAAGDVTTIPFKQIIISMGDGAKAALAAFEELKF